MLISVVIAAVGVGLITLGIKGFTAEGIAFSKSRTLTGRTARIVGVVCIIFGGLLAMVGFGFIVMLASRR
jgi:hypothetical protein